MPSPPPLDPFQLSDPDPYSRNATPTPFPVKRTRFSSGVRLVLGSAVVAMLSLGAWIGLQLFFQEPAGGTFTLPVIPPDSSPPGSVAAPASETPLEGLPTPPSPAAAPIPAAVAEEDSLDSLLRKLAGETSPAPELFIELAAISRERERDAEATAALRDGLQRHPGNGEILLALADNLNATGATGEAWEIVARAGHHNDHRFTSRLMRYGLESGHADETLVIFASSDIPTRSWTEEDWKTVVRLHEKTGQFDRAIEIAEKRVSERSEIFRLRAQKAKSAGQIPEAILIQEQYLAGLVEPAAADWRNLAELYEAVGRTAESDRAYRQADGAKR